MVSPESMKHLLSSQRDFLFTWLALQNINVNLGSFSHRFQLLNYKHNTCKGTSVHPEAPNCSQCPPVSDSRFTIGETSNESSTYFYRHWHVIRIACHDQRLTRDIQSNWCAVVSVASWTMVSLRRRPTSHSFSTAAIKTTATRNINYLLQAEIISGLLNSD